jgi:hypothetical protein
VHSYGYCSQYSKHSNAVRSVKRMHIILKPIDDIQAFLNVSKDKMVPVKVDRVSKQTILRI